MIGTTTLTNGFKLDLFSSPVTMENYTYHHKVLLDFRSNADDLAQKVVDTQAPYNKLLNAWYVQARVVEGIFQAVQAATNWQNGAPTPFAGSVKVNPQGFPIYGGIWYATPRIANRLTQELVTYDQTRQAVTDFPEVSKVLELQQTYFNILSNVTFLQNQDDAYRKDLVDRGILK